jgi:hypothetical protein
MRLPDVVEGEVSVLPFVVPVVLPDCVPVPVPLVPVPEVLLDCAKATPAAMVRQAAATVPMRFKDLLIGGSPGSLNNRMPR